MALQSPAYFKNLETGTTFVRLYEDQNNIPIDGSDPALRSLSPFTIQPVPPLFLGQGVASGGPDDPYSKRNLGGFAGGFEGGFLPSQPSEYGIYSAAFGEVNYTPSSSDSRTQQFRDGDLISGSSNRQNALRQYIYNGLLNLTSDQILKSKDNTSKTNEAQYADKLYAAEIYRQLAVVANTPPLVLLINPTSLQISYTKIAQFSDRTRKGYIYQSWGEEQPTMSVECRIGAFIAGQNAQTAAQAIISGQSPTPSGMQFASKRDSASYQQLMDILTIYQHGGLIRDTLSGAKNFLMVGAVQIEYDQNVYIGHMNNFSYNYDEGQANGGMTFSFEFTVNRMYDTTNDAQTFVRPMIGPQAGFESVGDFDLLNPSTSTDRLVEGSNGLGGGDVVVKFSDERSRSLGKGVNSTPTSRTFGFSLVEAPASEDIEQGVDPLSPTVEPFGV